MHLGDHWDMASLSSYDKGKRAFENRRYKKDIEAGNVALDLFEETLKKYSKGRGNGGCIPRGPSTLSRGG